MRTKCLSDVVCASLLLLLTCCSHVQTRDEPDALKEFWRALDQSWLPTEKDSIWTESQKENVREYAARFAQKNTPQKIVPAMVEDLKHHPSEVNAFIYTWVVLQWDAKQVNDLLAPFLKSNDPLEKQIASDFVAELESESEHRVETPE